MSILLTLAAVATAQAPAPASEGVTAYPAAFFAQTQPTTARDMVSQVPGFSFDGGDNVRGFGGSAGNVLIDGARPASKGDDLDSILRRIPASSVLRIDVIRGGAPGIDMHGKTVIANVVRRQDVKGKLTVTVQGSHAYDGRLSGQVLLDGERRIGAVALEGSLSAVKGFDGGSGNGTWTRVAGSGAPIVKARESTAGAAFIYKANGSAATPLAGGKLKVNGSLTVNPFVSDQTDRLIPSSDVERDHFHQRQDSAELGLRYERALSAKLALEIYGLQQLGRQQTDDTFTGSAAAQAITGDALSARFDLHKRTAESIGRVTLKYQAGKALNLEVGGEGDYNWMRSRTSFAQDGVLIPLPAANVRVAERRGEDFATATWQAHPKLTVEWGVKGEFSKIASGGDVISAHSFAFAKPRMVLSWSPDAADQVRLRLEREVGQLNFDDFTAQTAGINTGTVQTGNPRLNPGKDWVAEAAWDHRFWGSAQATVTLRHYRLSDVVDRAPVFDPAGTFDSPGNIGSGTKNEVAVNLTLPTDRLGLKHGLLTGQGTFRRSHVTDPTTDLAREISGLHPIDWEAHFTQGIPKWKATWGVEVLNQFRQSFYRFNELDTDKYRAAVNVFAEYKPREDLKFHMDVLDALVLGVKHQREVFTGLRDQSAVSFIDVRNQHVGRFVRLRVIKTFG